MQDLKRVIQSYVDEAIANPQNIIPETSGEINWNFVDADVTMNMSEMFGSELDDETLLVEFNLAADAYLNDFGHEATHYYGA